MDPIPTHNCLPSSFSGETDFNLDDDLGVIRSLSMSANVANSIKEEVNYSIRLSLEDTTPELDNDRQPQMLANVDAEGLFCSHILPKEENGIVVGFVLSKWDNIIGPQTVHVWLEENSERLNNLKANSCYHEANAMLMKAVKYVTCHTVNYLSVTAGASLHPAYGVTKLSTLNEKSTSLFVVPDLNIVAHSIVFTVQNLTSAMPYSVALIVNYKNYKYYLNIHRICQIWLRRLADQLHQQIFKCHLNRKEFETSDRVNHWVLEFNKMLFSLTPHPMATLPLIQECNKTVLSLPCLERALVSHLQTSGCSVVMGTSPTEVNALIEFLSLFLDTRELYFCRFVSQLPKYSFHMGLFLQSKLMEGTRQGNELEGLILDEYGCRQWSAEELAANPYQLTAIDLTRGSSVDAVKQSIPKHTATHSRHLHTQSLSVAWHPFMSQLLSSAWKFVAPIPGYVYLQNPYRMLFQNQVSMFHSIKSSNSVLVRTLIADLDILPTDCWKQMTKLFMEKVKTLARALLSLEDKMRGSDQLGTRNSERQHYLRSNMHLEEDDFLIVCSMATKIKTGNTF